MTSGVVIAGMIAAVAVVSTGYTAQRVDLSDASVWVSNGVEEAVGRVNTEVMELNSVMPGIGAEVGLLQSGATVLVVDRTNNTLGLVDPATSTVTDGVPLPPEDPEVFLTGDSVVIVAAGTGEVWFVALTDLAAFDAEALPALSLGAGLVASMDGNGRLFAYSPTAEKVYGLVPAESDELRSTDGVSIAADGDLSITSVDGTWAVLDAKGPTLYLPGHTVELDPAAGTPVLQEPGVAGSSVVIATSSGAIRVPLADGAPTTLVVGQSGVPARPLVSDGCVFAAWSGGNSWRDCADGPDPGTGVLLPLRAVPGDAALEFRSNDGRVLLNDSGAGGVWAVQAAGELIDNWVELIPPDDTEQRVDEDAESPPDLEALQLPPVAVDDELGARAGRATILPLLLNDYDPNGDVIVLEDVPTIDESIGRIDLVDDRQQLQLTLSATATGTVAIRYSINDGRGGTGSATATVTVRGAEENTAPAQVRSTRSMVAAGGRVTAEVLGDWVDPDGDAIYLARASVREPDAISFRPQGTVVFTSSGAGATSVSVVLAVSDGLAEGTGSLAVTVQTSGTVPIVADPFVVLTTTGVGKTVSPLDHVRGGSGALRLNSVPEVAGVSLVPNYDAGTFRFRSDAAGSYRVEYVVTDGDQSVTGVVRIDVAPKGTSPRPITIPKTVFVQTLSAQSVDVAGTDIDPAGGVLVVTGVMNLAPDSGVSAEVQELRTVRVRLDAPLAGPVTFNYRISNGTAAADGTITVIEVPVPDRLQPPVAADDTITVRAGAAIDIPVLANDEHPDGAVLTLLATLPQDLPEGAGLLFRAGTVLRYLAPTAPGNYLAVYEIEGPDGQRARAQLQIAVREADTATNSAPVAATLTARALAGESVTISVPLSGIDADGDTVQLLGQQTSPQKGQVVAVGTDSITYRADDYSAGTDEFEYAVIDALGARATGTVRVGISARQEGARNPVATIDEVTARPGTTISVQVLANDSDPDGSPLSVVSAEPNDDVTTAVVRGDLVVVNPPTAAGVYGIVYTIENELGGTSSNFVRIEVDPNAPLSYPVVTDTVLTLSDINGREAVTVDVLANVFFADGDPSELALAVQTGFTGNARVTGDRKIQVTLASSSQIIPFKVTHPDDPAVFSYGFIRIPGFDDALPQLDRAAPRLTVKSGERLTIDLADYVLAEGGKKVLLTDTSSVRATNGNGDDLVVDRDTLAFTSAERYFGAASISFEVTDGATPDDPAGRTATLVLPITVSPRDNQPPVFDGADLEFEPGEEKTIDLTRLTTYPYPDDTQELSYTAETVPEGFTFSLNGQQLTLRANESSATGMTASLSLGVRDVLAAGRAGRMQLTVVPSTRPLARAATDSVIVRRGESVGVDVLANDGATNPFPGTALRVVAIRGTDSAALPEGVAISPSPDRSSLRVTVAPTAAPLDTTVQYQITDATGDPSRSVWGSVNISVQDRPDPVSAVRVTEYRDRGLTVAWNSGAFNNSPISGYTVLLTDVQSGAVVNTTGCGGALCRVSTAGNGPGNAVRITVTATNAIGQSDAAAGADVVWSDVIPAAPTGITSSPLDQGLRVGWSKPAGPGGGTAITKYVVTVDGAAPVEIGVPASDPVGTVYSRDITGPSISNGSSVGFSVSARNQASTAISGWNSASGTGYPAGAPVLRGPSSPVSVSADTEGAVTASWSGGFDANGRAITEYYAAAFTGAAPSCTVRGELPGTVVVPGRSATFQYLETATSASFTGLAANTKYSFVVYAYNGMGCTASTEVEAIPRSRPGTVTDTTVTGPKANGDSRWDFGLTGFSIADGSTDADTFVYRLSGGTVEGGTHGPVAPGSLLESANGSQYGQRISVEVKACKKYDEVAEPLCSSNWSQPRVLGIAVANTALGDLVFAHEPPAAIDEPPATGTYTWLSSPSGAYDSVTYSCGGDPETVVDGAGGSCEVVEQLGIFADLTVIITVGRSEYVRTYNGNDYD